MREDILKILDYAIWAPSGDNSQPWKFEVSENKIRVFNVPERDTSVYNFKQAASLIAHGCLIENIAIAASEFGYKAEVNLLPDAHKETLIAEIVLNKDSPGKHNPLFPYITLRASNRKPYDTRQLSVEHKTVLENSVAKINTSARLRLIDDRTNIGNLARLASVNEKIVLENQKLHHFLFSHITWTEKEDKVKRGFFIKTLELQGPQKIAFKFFSNWPILKLFNKLGASNLVSKENAKLYTTSGAFVAITAPDTSLISFLKSGITAQRFWLTATKLGLAVQPLTGILFLRHRIINDDDKELSGPHKFLVNDAYSKIEKIFDVHDMQITMMFRVGYAKKPSAKCLRREAEIKFMK